MPRIKLERGDSVRLKPEFCLPSSPRDGDVLRVTKDGKRLRVLFPISKAVWVERTQVRKLPGLIRSAREVVCRSCGSASLRANKDDTYTCRKCGERSIVSL